MADGRPPALCCCTEDLNLLFHGCLGDLRLTRTFSSVSSAQMVPRHQIWPAAYFYLQDAHTASQPHSLR